MVPHTTKSDVSHGVFVVFLPDVISSISVPPETDRGLVTTHLSIGGKSVFSSKISTGDKVAGGWSTPYCEHSILSWLYNPIVNNIINHGAVVRHCR